MIHGGDIYSNKIEYDFSVNINPNGCPQQLIDAMKDSFTSISHYPDPEQKRARMSLAELEGVTPDSIICGNGASELIMTAVRSINPKKALLVSPGFYGYRHALNAIPECNITEYILKEEDFLLTEDILNYLTPDMDLLFLTNPNNPTGKNIDSTLLERILAQCESIDCTVILDECFLRLSDNCHSFKSSVDKYSNLYVIDAFTKLFACPGIRAGYLVSNADHINYVKNYLPEWNLSIHSEELLVEGVKVLQETDYLERSIETIKRERDYLQKELDCAVRSDTNFLLIKSYFDNKIFNTNLYSELLKHNILIRDCSNFSGLGVGWYRIAVKSHNENMLLIETIKDIYSEFKYDRTC